MPIARVGQSDEKEAQGLKEKSQVTKGRQYLKYASMTRSERTCVDQGVRESL